MTPNPAALPFATTDDEADSRFERFKTDDPFRETIPPALLNSADIYDYVRVTGMLFPFDGDELKLRQEEKLKGASYEADFMGDVYWFPDGALEPKKETIRKESVFTLKKNSIAFVYLDTRIRLPHYIAMRFNLRITHVHRGLLLGTGPLVDPGFVGRLLIPLHNLTSKDYTLIGGEGLIWAEFTKLSPHIENDDKIRNRPRELFSIQKRKIKLEAQAYFNRASDGMPARSSIPGEISAAKKTAEETAEKVNRYTWGAILTGALTVLTLGGATWSLISDANKNVYESSKNLVDSRRTLDDLSKDLDKLRLRLDVAEKKIETVEKSAARTTPTNTKKK